MRHLLTNARMLNVYSRKIEPCTVLIEDGIILSTHADPYSKCDRKDDLKGQILLPSFIDSHMHIESTMLTPPRLAPVLAAHGTGTIIADPHEIANVHGTEGIRWMLDVSRNLPVDFLFTLPSCVPSSHYELSGAELNADDLRPFYDDPQVVGLAEVMNSEAVLRSDPDMMQKITDARERHLVVNGHAPLLTGDRLDAYIAAGISDDHECSSFEEAKERIEKGQTVLIREGTAARNLEALLPLFESPWKYSALLCTDDRHPADLIDEGHIDQIIRKANAAGKDPTDAVIMASLQAARYYGLNDRGAIAPGKTADLTVVDSLEDLHISRTMKSGIWTDEYPAPAPLDVPANSMNITPLSAEDFDPHLKAEDTVRAIEIIPGQLITKEVIRKADDPDLAHIAVFERHHQTGRKGLGFVLGSRLEKGAFASSIGHDAHNLIVLGKSFEDMAAAANRVIEMHGGIAAAHEGKIVADLALPYGGLMADEDPEELARQNHQLTKALSTLGVPEDFELLMTTAFLALPVIPHLKITASGLISVDRMEPVSLRTENQP